MDEQGKKIVVITIIVLIAIIVLFVLSRVFL